VRCDPSHHGILAITPGYAIGCCGEDIVVCKDARLDLSDWCKPPVDPCADFRRQAPDYVPEVEIGCLRVPVGELRILDVRIQYDEKPTDPKTALGRGLCHSNVECEFTRVEESHRFAITEGAAGADPVKSAADAWLEEDRKCARIIGEYNSRFPKYGRTEQDFEDVRIWLLKQLEADPLHEFCFVRDCICDATAAPDEVEIIRWLFWIAQDRRNSFATCECHACQTGGGVPLARVWLRISGNRCTVICVDPRPPFRRHLSRDCWPAPHRSVNASRWLWRRPDEVCVEAASLRITLSARYDEIKWPTTLSELRDLFEVSPFVDCGDEVVAQVLNADGLGPRIVGFSGRRRGGLATLAPVNPAPQPEVPDDLTKLPNIGKTREEEFNAKGVTTFGQIGAMTRDELRSHLPRLVDEALDQIIRKANELEQQKDGGRG